MIEGVPTVLIVDDDADMRLLMRVVLHEPGSLIEVIGEAEDGFAAIAVYETLEPCALPDVVILDNRMPGRSGLEVATEILHREPDQHVVLFSAFVDDELEAAAREIGVDECVTKDDYLRLPDVVMALASASR